MTEPENRLAASTVAAEIAADKITAKKMHK
jgi:hypothetical protein